jgi:hypothetical protein
MKTEEITNEYRKHIKRCWEFADNISYDLICPIATREELKKIIFEKTCLTFEEFRKKELEKK